MHRTPLLIAVVQILVVAITVARSRSIKVFVLVTTTITTQALINLSSLKLKSVLRLKKITKLIKNIVRISIYMIAKKAK